MITLRSYQDKVVADFEQAVAAGMRRILIVAPTGAGKTAIAGEIIKRYAAARQTVLAFAHRREIISQISQKLHDLGIRHGIVMAGFSPRPFETVQVASIQTLHRRAVQSDAMQLPLAKLAWVDEAHHAPAASYRAVIDAFPDAIVVGTTATPCRGDGRGLGGIFELIIETPQVAQLIEQGHLVRTRVYAPVNPDLRGVEIRKGDYVESQLAERMDKPKLIGDVVTHWHKFGERRRTVVFGVSVQHSIHLRDEFIKSGVRAEHIDGGTPKLERDASLARLASGEIELLSNCFILTEGWDCPPVGCLVLARPTRKMGLFRQMVGRVLRPAEGKPDAIVLDHSGAVFRHGFVEDPVAWTLDPDRHASNPAHAARDGGGGPQLLECTQCGAVRVGGEACSSCGFLPQRPPRNVYIADGELARVVNGRAHASPYDEETRERWHAMFAYIAEERGYKPGWVGFKFKEKFGHFPRWGSTPEPIPPTPEVRSWVRSRMIAFARAQG